LGWVFVQQACWHIGIAEAIATTENLWEGREF
jgi:hypothetical protein